MEAASPREPKGCFRNAFNQGKHVSSFIAWQQRGKGSPQGLDLLEKIQRADSPLSAVDSRADANSNASEESSVPTYEYKCDACAHDWEVFQSMKDDALTECPACHAQSARRQISAGTGFILKGGGWSGGGAVSSAAAQPSSANEATGAQEKAMHERFEQVSGIKFGQS